MNPWILLLGIILLIIGVFLAAFGGIEKFSLERKDDIWLIVFILGMVTIGFSIGFIIYAYIVDKKSKYNPLTDLDNFYNISFRWPVNFLQPPQEKVVVKEQVSVGRFLEPVISPPLKVDK